MADERTENIKYFFREQSQWVYDESSEGESDHEEVHEQISGYEEADEDFDFDRTSEHENDDSHELEAPTNRFAGRPHSIIKGKNNFK